MNNKTKAIEGLPEIKSLPGEEEVMVFIESVLDSKKDKELATPFEIFKTYYTSLKDEESAYKFLSNLDGEISFNLKSEVRKAMNENRKNIAFLMKALVEEKKDRESRGETVGSYCAKNK